MTSLEGRRVVVTGAASGIGEATARGLARRGARVVVFDVDRPALDRTLRDCSELAGDVEVDVADTDAVAAAKAGVILLARTLALESAPTIRVNAVCPGYVLTPMQEREYSPEMLDEVNRRIPLRRHATPGEVADLFAFLTSDEARYITGQTLVVDGGETAGGVASRHGPA